MSISEIMKGAPKYLSMRYGSLHSYVWQALFPQDYINKVLHKIDSPKEKKEKMMRMKSLADEASILVFIFYTKKMLTEGATATKNTVDILKELKVDEFRLGNTDFSKRNKNVVLGDILSEKLLSLLSNEIKNLLSEVVYISQIIDYYKGIRNSEYSYNYLFDQKEAILKLNKFFYKEKPRLNSFGNVVNQVFEAYTFASTIKWYEKNGWKVNIVSPVIKKKRIFKLKFSTKGIPNRYSYAICEKEGDKCQIRHQLRVATKSFKEKNKYRANICCDVVVLNDIDLSGYFTDMAIPNSNLISFGEVKHMSAYAELIAGFIGMVHELQPIRLKKRRIKKWKMGSHISPYLNVSGFLQHTAKGLNETIESRKYDIDVYSYENKIVII